MRIHYTFLYVGASVVILIKKDMKKGWQMMIRSYSVEAQASRTDERYLLSIEYEFLFCQLP